MPTPEQNHSRRAHCDTPPTGAPDLAHRAGRQAVVAGRFPYGRAARQWEPRESISFRTDTRYQSGRCGSAYGWRFATVRPGVGDLLARFDVHDAEVDPGPAFQTRSTLVDSLPAYPESTQLVFHLRPCRQGRRRNSLLRACAAQRCDAKCRRAGSWSTGGGPKGRACATVRGANSERSRSLRRRTQRREVPRRSSWSGGEGPKRRAREAFRRASPSNPGSLGLVGANPDSPPGPRTPGYSRESS